MKFRKPIAALLFLSMLLGLAGCAAPAEDPQSAGTGGLTEGDVPSSPAAQGAEPLRTSAEKAADFAVRLFRKSLKDGENTLVSPLSVLSALAMTANGARGDTLAEMEKVLGMRTEELNAYYHHHIHLGMHWISVCILFAIAYAINFPYTLFTNFLLFTVDSEIIRVWNGQKADFKRGWRTAASHFWSLVTWSLLITPFNFMWIASMCIVIPVLTRDKTVNPFKMLGRAVLLLLKIWKEFLLGIVGMLVIVYWLYCLVYGSAEIFNFISSQCPPLLAWVLLSVSISLSLVALCFCYLFCNVYLCGQYIKASEGVEPEPSPEADSAELA